MRDFDQLETLCARLRSLIDEGDGRLALRVPQVSAWSIGQQIDHMLKILDRGLTRIEKGGKTPSRGINLAGRAVLALGWIPRGVGKAPEGMEGMEATAPDLATHLDAIRTRLAAVRARPGGLRPGERILPHPYFGGLDLPQTVRFWVVHTVHHLKIVADIRRAADD
jgi:hypothetical protein